MPSTDFNSILTPSPFLLPYTSTPEARLDFQWREQNTHKTFHPVFPAYKMYRDKDGAKTKGMVYQ